MTTFTTHPVSLKTLLNQIEAGHIQLPEFQRGWVWDDYRIRALLASISRGFPIGAVMTLQAGGNIKFKTRLVEGVDSSRANESLSQFLLDGQQRLTSLYQALKYEGPVNTRDSRNKRIKRWYYIDMIKAADDSTDREEAVVSVPEDRRITRDFGREETLNLSTRENEYQHHMLPTECIFDPMGWMLGYLEYWQAKADKHPFGNPISFWGRFNEHIINAFAEYDIPVIDLAKQTPKEAVCTVFEKVNTGGVTLTVFELVTASFAADDFALRDDWDARRSRMHAAFGVLRGIEGEQFLQAVTLLATQEQRRRKQREQPGAPPNQVPRIGCQKRDILSLTLAEYVAWADEVERGFEQTAKFLHSQFVFKLQDVPYNTQLVPLAALFVELGSELTPADANARLEHWYWSGIFGEVYGGAIETQYALDLAEVAEYVRRGSLPRLITEATFSPERLISLRSRISAAYRGLYALQMKSHATDWRTGKALNVTAYHDDPIDIHHIFPVAWCKANPPIPEWLYNSIINKTPIDAETNRRIGGRAPSGYLPLLRRHNARLDETLRSHWLNPDLLEGDDFSGCFIERGEQMLGLISRAMGRNISGREVFRSALIRGMPEGWGPDDEADVDGLPEFDDFEDAEPDYDEIGLVAYSDEGVGSLRVTPTRSGGQARVRQ